MKKKLLTLFSAVLFLACVITCVVMVSGCSLVRGNENFKESDLEEQTDNFLNSWFEADFEGTIETYKEQMDENTLAQYQTYAKQKKKYQGIEKKLKTEFTITTDSATVTETILCKSGDKVMASVTFTEEGSIQTDESGNYTFKFEPYKTLGAKMGKAGINTVMSMAIVFLVLVFISLLIFCFQFIPSVGGPRTDGPRTPAPAAPAPVQNTAAQENLVDDLELVAVITAAIAAATEAESTDGLVVRSIIRR